MPEILPHPLRGTMTIGSERVMPVFGSVRAADGATDEHPIITITGTDGSEDRHGTPIEKAGWAFSDYMRNAVALWAHGAVPEYPPVGRTLAIRSIGGAWDFDIELMPNPWRNLSDNLPAFLWDWYREGGPLAASVSFIPKAWEDYESKTIPSFFSEGVRYTKQELTEISFVNVPSNRNAVAKAIERSRAAGRMTDGMAKILGYEISPIIIRTTPIEIVPPAEPVTEVPKTAPQTAFRTALKSYATALRCCDPYYDSCSSDRCELCWAILGTCNCDETLTPEQAAIEQSTLAGLMDIAAQELALALDGWKTSEHDTLSQRCESIVIDCMFRIDRLDAYMDYWYEGDSYSPSMEMPDMRAFIKAVTKDAAAIARVRAGAVLSAGNKGKLQKAIDLHGEIATMHETMGGHLTALMESATKSESADGGSNRDAERISNTGNTPLEQGAKARIRVLKPDAAAAGAERSNEADQPKLYSRIFLKK